MAIVLVLLGLLLGNLLTPFSATLERTRILETRAALAQAHEALLGFAVVHGILPHPDSDGDGTEDLAFTGEGTLPWVTLGLSSSAASDAWGRTLRYRAEPNFLGPLPDPPDTASGIRLQDATGYWTADNPDALAAVLFSLGRDGLGNGDNGNGDARYSRLDYCIEACAVSFDDEVVVVSRNVLIARLAAVGRWP